MTMNDSNQLKNRQILRKEEEKKFITLKSDRNELRRKSHLLDLESRESDELIEEIITSVKNRQKNFLDATKEITQLMADYNNNSNNVLSEYSSLEKTIRKDELDNVHRLLNLPKVINEESITNMVMESDSKLNQVSALLDAETKKVRDIKDARLKLEEKALIKSVTSFTIYLKKMNFKHEIERK